MSSAVGARTLKTARISGQFPSNLNMLLQLVIVFELGVTVITFSALALVGKPNPGVYIFYGNPPPHRLSEKRFTKISPHHRRKGIL